MALRIELNGKPREFAELNPGDSLQAVVTALELKSDRIAVEQNGEITPRASWANTPMRENDKVEIVHFVGGGCGIV
jgi:sulfur carrier protein